MPCSLFLQTHLIHTVVEMAGITLQSHLSDSVERQLSYPGFYKPGEGPKHLGAWGIPWVVCSGDSPRRPPHDFPKCVSLRHSACPHFRWESVPAGRTLHSTLRNSGFPTPLAVALMPPTKGANSAVSLRGKPPWETAQKDHLQWRAAELLVAGQPPGVWLASQRALTVRHSRAAISLRCQLL